MAESCQNVALNSKSCQDVAEQLVAKASQGANILCTQIPANRYSPDMGAHWEETCAETVMANLVVSVFSFSKMANILKNEQKQHKFYMTHIIFLGVRILTAIAQQFGASWKNSSDGELISESVSLTRSLKAFWANKIEPVIVFGQ